MEEKILNQILLEIREMKISTNEKLEKIDERFEKIDERFEEIDEKFEKIDERFEEINQTFKQIDKKFDDMKKETQEKFDKLTADIVEQFKIFSDIIAERERENFEKLNIRIDKTNKQLQDYKNNVKRGIQELKKAVS